MLRVLQGGLEGPRWVAKLPPRTDATILTYIQYVAGEQMEVRATNRMEALLIAPPGSDEGYFARLFAEAEVEIPREANISLLQIEQISCVIKEPLS